MNALQWLWAMFSWGFMPLYFGGKSSSAQSSTTNNTDARVAVQDGVGVSNNTGTAITITDGGIVSRALDSVDTSNATMSQGYETLIEAATEVFNRGQGLIGQTQAAVADAYSQAQTDKSSTIDNRTLIALAVAAVAGLFLFSRGRK